MVLQAKEYIDPPPEGWQFVMIRLKVKNNTAEPMSFNASRLDAVGKSGIAFDERCEDIFDLPDDFDPFKSSREMFEGGELEGNICLTVKSSDVDDSLLMFYDRKPRLFWSLSETTATSELIALRQPAAMVDVQPTPTAVGENRNNPILFGQSQITSDGFSLWVVNMIENATAEVLAESSSYIKPPDEGHQLVLVRIKVKNNISESKNFNADGRLRTVGNASVEYWHCKHHQDYSMSIPDEFDDSREIFEGGELEGNLCFSVKSSDVDSIVLYDMEDRRKWLYWGLR